MDRRRFSVHFQADPLSTFVRLQRVSGDARAALVPGGGQQRGFDGTMLFLEDAVRFAPFDPAATIPDAMQRPVKRRDARATTPLDSQLSEDATLKLARDYLDKLSAAPFAVGAMKTERRRSRQQPVRRRGPPQRHRAAADRQRSASGVQCAVHPLQHAAPRAGRRHRCDRRDSPGRAVHRAREQRAPRWTLTTNPLDVTDVYQERIVERSRVTERPQHHVPGRARARGRAPADVPLQCAGDGVNDNLNAVPPGGAVPPAVLIVPRRNQGPIVQLDLATGVAISVQYAGFGGTREVDAFRGSPARATWRSSGRPCSSSTSVRRTSRARTSRATSPTS